MKYVGIFFLLVIILPWSFALGASLIFSPWLLAFCLACYLAQKLRRLTLRQRVR